MNSKKELSKDYRPCPQEVEKYLKKWKEQENYVSQERSLQKLFQLFPKNASIEDILMKSSSLNDFYSTNIFSTYTVAKHILELKIDERLAQGDLLLVNEIARVPMEAKGKEKYFYCFATKYCSHHFPDFYPIYDGFVEKVLMYFKKRDRFATFVKADLKDYRRYKKIISDFRNYYGLEKFSFKQLDRYLWQLGKDYFPTEY